MSYRTPKSGPRVDISAVLFLVANAQDKPAEIAQLKRRPLPLQCRAMWSLLLRRSLTILSGTLRACRICGFRECLEPWGLRVTIKAFL